MARRLALILLPAAAPFGAAAHAPQAHASAWHEVLAQWSFDPWVVLPLLVSGGLYALGVARLWRSAGAGRGIPAGRAACFTAGWLAVVLALVSPLDALGGFLFSAHMVQHEVLMLVAAPLLVLGRPLAAWAWALPPAGRRGAGRVLRGAAWSAAWRALTGPVSAWSLHAVALWLWHVPALFDATLRSDAVHTLQHASFLGTALLFWWVVLGDEGRVARRAGPALFFLFTTMLHTSVLGALLALAPSPWYPGYAPGAAALGVDLLEDQQLGGLVMWVPCAFAYIGASLALLARLIGASQAAATPARRSQPRPEDVPFATAPRAGRYSQPTQPSQPHCAATSSITSNR